MTDEAQHPRTLTARGATYEIALGELLTEAIALIGNRADAREADQSVRFQATAETRTALIGACLNALMEQIDAFDRRPLTISLDGVRPLAIGYRAWGSLFLDPDKPAQPARIRTVADAVLRATATGLEISLEVSLA